MAVSLSVASSAGAYSAGEKRAEGKQNTRIKSALKGVNGLKAVDVTQAQSLVDLRTLAESTDARLKVIEGAAPQIISGLDQLKTGLTKAGEGLTALQALAGATEYGIGQVVVLEPAPNPQEGSFVETPDVPDAVQQAQTSQEFLAQQAGNLAVAYGVRSGEADGTGSGDPAAVCKVTVTNEGGTTQTTAANPSLGGLPFQPVNTKSALTSTDPANAGFPFGLKSSGADADQTTTFVSTVPVAAGETYTVGLSCVDTTPSSSDPKA
jgi:hypothetical protein